MYGQCTIISVAKHGSDNMCFIVIVLAFSSTFTPVKFHESTVLSWKLKEWTYPDQVVNADLELTSTL